MGEVGATHFRRDRGPLQHMSTARSRSYAWAGLRSQRRGHLWRRPAPCGSAAPDFRAAPIVRCPATVVSNPRCRRAASPETTGRSAFRSHRRGRNAQQLPRWGQPPRRPAPQRPMPLTQRGRLPQGFPVLAAESSAPFRRVPTRSSTYTERSAEVLSPQCHGALPTEDLVDHRQVTAKSSVCVSL